MKKIFLLLLVSIFLSMTTRSYGQVRTMGHPTHIFAEFGPIQEIADASTSKNGTHFAAGLKKHSWIEDRPIQFEYDMNYRGISFYDSSDTQKKFGLAEFYLGPRLLISKTSPLYPTASVLGGGYFNLNSVGGLSAMISLGVYYNFTEPKTPRNGCSLELTYHTAKIKFEDYVVPPAFALRIGFFF